MPIVNRRRRSLQPKFEAAETPSINFSPRQLEHLKQMFPNVLPGEDTSLEELRLLQGQQRVVSYISTLTREE